VQERRNGWRLHKQKWDAGGRRAILLATHCRASDFCQALPKWNHTTLQGCVIPYNRSDDTNPFLILSCDDEMRTGRASKDHISVYLLHSSDLPFLYRLWVLYRKSVPERHYPNHYYPLLQVTWSTLRLHLIHYCGVVDRLTPYLREHGPKQRRTTPL
jgi:hypothetical protein